MKMSVESEQNGTQIIAGSNFSLAAIAVLGRLDRPTDGVRDYCSFLSEAFLRRGDRLDLSEVRWEDQGWFKSLRKLWTESRGWTGRWVLFQYTALMWSRRGFPNGALAALCMLRLRKTKLCVVFHDVTYDNMAGIKQRVRVPFQYWTMRRAFQMATRCVLTVPLTQLAWLPQNTGKAIFIPVGANIPAVDNVLDDGSTPRPDVPTVAIFGISGGGAGEEELDDIVHVANHAKSSVGRLRLTVLGRGSKEAESVLRKRLEASGIDIEVLGLLPAADIRKALLASSALLCVRGQISTRRGNAIAGIVCGLPVVGYSGGETGFPITEAGLVLLEGRDRQGAADALCRILTDDKLSAELRQRSTVAAQKYFSWEAIAEQFHQALSEG